MEPDAGNRTPDSGSRTPDAGHRTGFDTDTDAVTDTATDAGSTEFVTGEPTVPFPGYRATPHGASRTE